MTNIPTYVPFSENDQRTHEAILIAETRQISLLLFRLAGRAIEALSRGLDEGADMGRVRTLSALMSKAIWAHDLMERRICDMMGREEKRRRLEDFQERQAARKAARRAGSVGPEQFASGPGSAPRHDLPRPAREHGEWDLCEQIPASSTTPSRRKAGERLSGVCDDAPSGAAGPEQVASDPDTEDWADALEAAVASHDHRALQALGETVINPLMAELEQFETSRAKGSGRARDPTV